MSTQRFTPEFKEEAVRQVVERGYTMPDLAGDRHDRCPLRFVLPSVLEHHAHRALAHLGRKLH